MDYGVITFTSTYGAIYAQKVLRPAADVLTMPVLREISLGCGIAVRFKPEDLDTVRAALAASTLNAQSAGLLPPGRRNFSLKSVRIPAKKLLASGPKFLAAGHIANFQTSPSKNAAAAASAVRRHSTDGGPFFLPISSGRNGGPGRQARPPGYPGK